jgi:putative membrane protein
MLKPSSPPAFAAGDTHMMTDLILAVLHYLLVFVVVGILGAQAALVRPGMDAAQAVRAAVLDRGYGAAAGLLLAAGFLRVFFGAKGADFYLHNPVFWAKIAVFALIGALSILPTVRFFGWHGRASKDPGFKPAPAEVRGVRRLIVAEIALLPVLPVLAGLMARGYGM